MTRLGVPRNDGLALVGEPLHRRARQLFYVLEGKIEMEIRGEVLELGAGDALEVAPGESHRVRNTSSADASLIVISAPSTAGNREENEPLPTSGQVPR